MISVLKVMAIRDSQSKALAAHAVPRKGVDPGRYSVACVVRFVEWLGYRRVILHTDNERAIISLVKESLKSFGRTRPLMPKARIGMLSRHSRVCQPSSLR